MFSALNTQFTGKVFIHLSSVDSTNNYASKLLNEEVEDGTVIIADYQTNGRGQYDRAWLSNTGENLLCSIIYKPTFLHASNVHQMHWVVSAAIFDWLDELSFTELSIKPPNDVYFQKRKLGGILIQNSIQKNVVQHSIIGIGINVNQTMFDPSLPNPVSMKQISGRDWDISSCLNGLLIHLEQWYLRLKGNHPTDKLKQYYDSLLMSIPE